MNIHRCIWCTAEKPESEFNVEHVMPRSFGTFEANLTLVNEVCKECAYSRWGSAAVRGLGQRAASASERNG